MASAEDEWKETLSGLLKAGRKGKATAEKPHGWSTEDLEGECRRIDPNAGGVSARNIALYEAMSVKKMPSKALVAFFAKGLGEPPEDWIRQVFPENQAQSLLRGANSILDMQRLLAAGDTVIIISARSFLEAKDQTVAEVVLDKLRDGVRYQYLFPTEWKHDDGDAARYSFARFIANNVTNRSLASAPRIAGFEVSPTLFHYFSPLCTIVRFESSKPGLTQTFGFIEIAKDEYGSTEGKWYAIAKKEWKKIESELHATRVPVAESHAPIQPSNPQLTTISDVYARWFGGDANVTHYQQLRPVLGHGGDACVTEINRTVSAHPFSSSLKSFKYLDIGCGDGAITKQIASSLKNRGDVAVTALDVSDKQMRIANDELKELDCTAIAKRFEDYNSTDSFNVITSIHSAYVLDLTYLRRVYHLLAPGGIALFWMASGINNIVTAMTASLDKILWYGQERNTAEDVVAWADLYGLNPQVTSFEERTIPSLLTEKNELNEDSLRLIEYCALKSIKGNDSALKQASKVLVATRTDRGEHPLKDVLISITKPNKPS